MTYFIMYRSYADRSNYYLTDTTNEKFQPIWSRQRKLARIFATEKEAESTIKLFLIKYPGHGYYRRTEIVKE